MENIWKMVIVLMVVAVGAASASAQVLSASENWTVGPGDYILTSGIPGCGQNTVDPINEAAQALAAGSQGGVYGALISVLQSAAQTARPQIGGTIGGILDAIYGGGRYANCVPVSVVLPAGARIVGYQFVASDGHGSGLCVLGQDCQIGWSRFDPPQRYNAGNSLIVASTFRNWSHDRTRSATMTVYFTTQ
jgi:hypothetical protein